MRHIGQRARVLDLRRLRTEAHFGNGFVADVDSLMNVVR
jgi:hypothetical protein